MSSFDAYSRYYDLLYQDKDYAAECQYIERLIKGESPEAKSILNLGCGTGKHDLILAASGYNITGVDMSESMIEGANNNIAARSDLTDRVSFVHHDIRTLRLDKTYDIVTSLFHVMSYQTTDEDLEKAFETAQTHLGNNGVFIFDCWHGPAVLSDPPVVRVKRMSDNDLNIVRIAEPVVDKESNTVAVNYEVLLYSKDHANFDVIRETHMMRYLFTPEIELLAKKHGFVISSSFSWMTSEPIKDDSWSVVYVLTCEAF